MKSRTWHIRIQEWFPPNDDVATIMAQLCVLREDLYLELEGMKEDDIASLDYNGEGFRSIYFFRNSTKTLFEMRKVVGNLKRQAEFMKKLAKQREFHKAFKDFDTAIFKSRNLLKRLRHETSGHVDQKAFECALQIIAPDTKQLFQAGDTPRTLHYKFCLEFLGAVFLRKADTDFEVEWRKILKATADVSFKAINAVDMLFMAYVEQRGFQY
ncbi:MAG: hypothetical protein QM706_01025 [Nitrospira sp.]